MEPPKQKTPRFPTSVREPTDWQGQRPLKFFYRGDKREELAKIARDYTARRITYDEMKALIPLETNFLHGTEAQKERCRGQVVLGVLAWCPIMDEQIDLDGKPEDHCFTIQLMMAVEAVYGEKVYMHDLFPDCQRTKERDGCRGQRDASHENEIHSIAAIIELTVAYREYGIRFRGFWGMCKLWVESIDAAVFPHLEWANGIPRFYTPFHAGKIWNKNYEMRKVGMLTITEAMGKAWGKTTTDVYESLKAWFDERPIDLKIPSLEIEKHPRVAETVAGLLSGEWVPGYGRKKPAPKKNSPALLPPPSPAEAPSPAESPALTASLPAPPASAVNERKRPRQALPRIASSSPSPTPSPPPSSPESPPYKRQRRRSIVP